MSQPRESTDQERAPLLENNETGNQANNQDENKSSWFHRIGRISITERILIVVSVVLLILASTFIGLYISARVDSSHRGGKGETTLTITATSTVAYPTTPGPGPTQAPGDGGSPNDICMIPACISLAAQILDSMNTSADPCDSFYDFATRCDPGLMSAAGGWRDKHSIPADRGTYGQFDVMGDNTKRIILRSIESVQDEARGDEADQKNKQKLKMVYDSCMDEQKLDELGAKPILKVVHDLLQISGRFDHTSIDDEEKDENVYHALALQSEVNGNEPVDALEGPGESEDPSLCGKRLSKRRKITKALAFLNARGVDGLLRFRIDSASQGSEPHMQMLYLYQAAGGLPAKNYYKDCHILKFYQAIIENILMEISSAEHTKDLVSPHPAEETLDYSYGHRNTTTRRMKRLAGKVVELERKLILAGAELDYLQDPHHFLNAYSTQEVEKALPWLDFMAFIASTPINTRDQATYPQQVIVTYPPYLKSLTHIIDNTPEEVISAYFVIRLVLTHGGLLGPTVSIRQNVMALKAYSSGTDAEDRQNLCLSYADTAVGYLAARELVKSTFSIEMKKDVESILSNIVQAFKRKLPTIEWMDETSAQAAQRKVEAIKWTVGYPEKPNINDPESLRKYYSDLSISKNDFFGNMLNSAMLERARKWSTVGKNRDDKTWGQLPTVPDAYATPADMEVIVPAGVIQQPLYRLGWPASYQYGCFGSLLAHEMTHFFDNNGAIYDETGRVRDWWTNATIAAFEKRAQCIAHQYSKFYIIGPDGKKVYLNANFSNGEDIADSGVSQAYAAWKASGREKELRLPGIKYTPEQLFFLGYGNIWASESRPAYAVAWLLSDPHTPRRWRVDGTLRNSKEFHEAWNCPVGSKMHPPKEDQCELW